MRIITRLNVGGTALHCLALSESLASAGFDTILVTGEAAKDEGNYDLLFGIEPKGFRIVRMKFLRRLPSGIGDLMTLLELIRLIRKEKPDIVDTHTAKAGFLGRLAAWICGAPVIIHTFHGHVLSGYFPAPVNWLIRSAERFLARRTTLIIATSEPLKEELCHKYGITDERKVEVVPLGTDLSAYKNTARLKGGLRKELGLDQSRIKLIGCVARLVPIKDHALLLDAFAELAEDRSIHLVLVGDGELRAKLMDRVTKLGLGSQVHFLGWRADLPKIYADLDLSVISSRNEGTPFSIIESFASGCPVVATEVGGVPTLFSDSPRAPMGDPNLKLKAEGILVPYGDARILARAMAATLSDPKLRAELSARGPAMAARYSLSELSDRMAKIYSDLIERTRLELEEVQREA